jgi:hypothetical protein
MTAFGALLVGLVTAVLAPYLAAQRSRLGQSGRAGSRWTWRAVGVVATAAGLLLALFGCSRLFGIDLWHPWYYALVTSSFVSVLSLAHGLVYFAEWERRQQHLARPAKAQRRTHGVCAPPNRSAVYRYQVLCGLSSNAGWSTVA